MIQAEIEDCQKKNAIVNLKPQASEENDEEGFGPTLYSDKLSQEKRVVKPTPEDIWVYEFSLIQLSNFSFFKSNQTENVFFRTKNLLQEEISTEAIRKRNGEKKENALMRNESGVKKPTPGLGKESGMRIKFL